MVNSNDIRLVDVTACENAGRRLDKIAVRVAGFAPLVIMLVTTGSVAEEPATLVTTGGLASP